MSVLRIRYVTMIFFVVSAVQAFVAGCPNNKGSLTLELIPTRKVFQANEPIAIDAVFRSNGGTACIDVPTPNRFDGEIREIDSGESISRAGVAQCGMLGLLLVPLIPGMYVYSALDVADTVGRFQVVREGAPITYSFVIHPGKQNFWMTPADEPDQWHSDRQFVLAPGRYQLQIQFQSDMKKAYPAPLGWSVYPDPVSATADFAIKEQQ